MKTVSTREKYTALWERECKSEYQAVDELEKKLGFAVDRAWMNRVAAVLNCPVKVNLPNWQHGRVIYAVLRDRLKKQPWNEIVDPRTLLDIGTAKGFSAVVMARALADSGIEMPVYTVDVIEPQDRVIRNTIAEVDGLKTLYEVMDPFVPTGAEIKAFGCGSKELIESMQSFSHQIPFAFVDGKHAFEAVRFEGLAIAKRQRHSDVIVFDDCQIPEVMRAVVTLTTYSIEYIQNGPRLYAIATRK